MKILVVDDTAYMRLIVRKTLERSGFEVLEASSGTEALDTIGRESGIGFVVTDLMMPDMDGNQLLERVGALERVSDGEEIFPPPFILLTATPNPDAMRKAKAMGFVDIMAKPLDPDRLLGAIKEHLGSGGKQKCDSSVALQNLTTAISRTVSVEDWEGAQVILEGLQDGMREIESFLQNKPAAEEKDTDRNSETEGGNPQ